MDPTSLVSAKWIVNDSASNDSVSSLLVAGPCKLKMLSFANEANEPGLLVLRDGTVTGDIKLQIFVGQGLGPVSHSTSIYGMQSVEVPIPGDGIRFDTGIFAISDQDDDVETPGDMKLGTVTVVYSGA